MTNAFIIALAVGMSLGICAVVMQRGANVVKLDKKMAGMSLLVGGIMLAVAAAGYGIGRWVIFMALKDHSLFWIHALAGVLLIGLGVQMLVKAFRKKTILEHRMAKINMREDIVKALPLCVDALLIGVVCGLLMLHLLAVILAVFLVCILFVIIGYVVGQNLGVAWVSQSYAVGGGLLCLLGVVLQIV